MKHNELILFLITLFILIFFTNHSSSVEILRIKGSNTVLPVIDEATFRWQELKPDVTIEFSGPGSGAGFSALLDGTADIAPMSRPPKTTELAQATASGFNITQSIIGKDALIVVLNIQNPITSLSTENITDIYSGTIRDWTEFDSSISFADTKIKIIERDENSGTHDYFNAFFLNNKSVPSNELGSYYSQHTSTSKLFEIVQNEENAIGYGGLAYLTKNVKAINIDDIEPTVENTQNNKYPISRELFLVWDFATLSTTGKEFINYMFTPEGQYIVRIAGYVPITTAAASYTSISNISQSEISGETLAIGAVFLIIAKFAITKHRKRMN